MRIDHRHFSRRAFAGSALAAAAVITNARAFAAIVPPTTGSPLGPFYPVQHPADDDADLAWMRGHAKRAIGQVIEVTGRVLDRRGNPVTDTRLEVWQCNAAGRYAHANDISTAPLDPDFQGYAAIRTGAGGEWRITTIKPAGYDSPIGKRSPHIHFDIRGISQRLIAQMYFPEDSPANARDRLYRNLGDDAPTSLARSLAAHRYRWDIVLMDG
jgi:protocatechuate 3,4-dioxygenase, beta subunit